MLFNLTANNERGVHHLKRINKTEKLLLGRRFAFKRSFGRWIFRRTLKGV